MSETPESKFNAGSIQVAVWDNESKEGNKFQSISIQKRYKVGEEWKTTNSLNVNEIPKAILALQKAYEKSMISEQDAKDWLVQTLGSGLNPLSFIFEAI